MRHHGMLPLHALGLLAVSADVTKVDVLEVSEDACNNSKTCNEPVVDADKPSRQYLRQQERLRVKRY